MRGERRLTKTEQYALVYREGGSRVGGLLVMRMLPNSLECSRYGISISKRVGNAVTRNRVKRLLKENLRQTRIKAGWDVVFLARVAVSTAGYVQIGEAVNSLLSRAGILISENDQAGFNTD